MKHLYVYPNKTTDFIKRLWLLAALFICVLQASAQCPPGNVTFNTQAEINAFAEAYPNCTQISGDLLIAGYAGTITDLSGLYNKY